MNSCSRCRSRLRSASWSSVGSRATPYSIGGRCVQGWVVAWAGSRGAGWWWSSAVVSKRYLAAATPSLASGLSGPVGHGSGGWDATDLRELEVVELTLIVEHGGTRLVPRIVHQLPQLFPVHGRHAAGRSSASARRRRTAAAATTSTARAPRAVWPALAAKSKRRESCIKKL